MTNVTINGTNIVTSKRGVSVTGDVIRFGDGSTYNTSTGVFNNLGPGDITVNGVLLSNKPGESKKAGENNIITKSNDFKATALELKLRSADVHVMKHDKLNIHVELIGQSEAVDSIDFKVIADTLQIEQTKSSEKSSGDNIGNALLDGRDIIIEGKSSVILIGGHRSRQTNESIDEQTLQIKIYVPLGTSIAADINGSGDVTVEGVEGNLLININDSGDVKARDVSGVVSISVAGSGDVDIKRSKASNLEINVAGSGDVDFRGSAENAILSLAGSGAIFVDHVVNQPIKNKVGSGSIKIGKIGWDS